MALRYMAAFLVAIATSVALVPTARKLAFRFGAVSTPGGRNVNREPMPRLGGIAIFIALWLPVLALFFADERVRTGIGAHWNRLAALVLGAALLLVVGALDDLRGVRARTKLLAQVLAAAIAFAGNFRIDVVALPLFGNVDLGWVALPLTIIWVVGVVNAINLIDGLDGLAAGITFFAAITNFVVAYMFDSTLVSLVMVSTLGAVLGFLVYNWNPARIFMGDSGSYSLGYVLALTAIAAPFQKASATVSLLVPIVSLGIPLVDTLLAMLRRVLERRSIFSPDRGHIHHRLLDMGITHRRAVLIIYGTSVALTIAAIVISLGRDWQVGVAISIAAVAIFLLVRAAGFFRAIGATRGPGDEP
ncbi:MAG: undecaprenyl/decaprenyl-phosphate alpha-N-acetylglucosaminyl 1-phosphate transferase [Deltaproteobacteria bacterium]|nr:undecaprenyl/decaprenyl-phosphate alpha-N-acetylglucosaminyl 1-phosphate transferase [Deltaproteobacteria bacterium]